MPETGKGSAVDLRQGQAVSFGDGTQDFAGIAGGNHTGGNIPGDDAARSDDASIADGYTAADGNMGAQPDIFAQRDGAGGADAVRTLAGIQRVA